MDDVSPNHLTKKASEIDDPDFKRLVAELDGAVGLLLDREQMVINYLAQVVYPLGADMNRLKIDGSVVIPTGVLDTRLGKLKEGIVYEIFDQLARLEGGSAELYEKSKLYVCINKLARNEKKKPRNKRHLRPCDFSPQ